MQFAFLFLHIVIVLFLITVVLLQRSEGGALGIGGGGGVMSGRGAATALQKVSWGLGIAFIVSSIFLALYNKNVHSDVSIADDAVLIEAEQPLGGLIDSLAPALPDANLGDLGGDLLPTLPAPVINVDSSTE